MGWFRDLFLGPKKLSYFDQILNRGWPDPWPELMTRCEHPEGRWRMHLGRSSDDTWVKSEPQTQVMILGPPQVAGKTSGCIIPAVLTAPGPVVVTSIKDDVYAATCQTRARMGTVWHFSLDGSTLPGCRQLRWSPITPARDWGAALILATAMARSAEMGEGVTNARFFENRAGRLLACLLHAAALGGKDMAWVLAGVELESNTVREAQDILATSDEQGAGIAHRMFSRFVDLDSRSQGPIFGTASAALGAYQIPEGLATTLRPNFDPADFVAGDPEAVNRLRWRPQDWASNDPGLANMGIVKSGAPGGFFDSIFITASTETQEAVAPLVVGLLTQIIQATYAQHRADTRAGVGNRLPVTLILDEVANIAPIPELPKIASQAAGQGLMLMIAAQDMSQLRDIWHEQADGFFTFFRPVIFPGIADMETLDLIVALCGKYWHQTTSYSRGVTDGKASNSTSTSEQLMDRFTHEDIFIGRDPVTGTIDLDRLLLITSGGYSYCWVTKYFSTKFWQSLLMSTAASVPTFDEDFIHPILDAPLPPLALNGDTRYLHEVGGERWVDWWKRIVADTTAARNERRAA